MRRHVVPPPLPQRGSGIGICAPIGLCPFRAQPLLFVFPRVGSAALRQPWAVFRHPVGVLGQRRKDSYLLSFLKSVPEVAAKLKEANTKDRKFEDVVKSVEQATVLVLVY